MDHTLQVLHLSLDWDQVQVNWSVSQITLSQLLKIVLELLLLFFDIFFLSRA
jgi:hypothetical protein